MTADSASHTQPVPTRDLDTPDPDPSTISSTSDESPAHRTAADPPITSVAPDRTSIVARQKERFAAASRSGRRSSGWLTATPMTELLIALLAPAGCRVRVATSTSVDQAVQESQNTPTPQTVGLVGAITPLVVLPVAYHCTGYMAGRMARFNRIGQGLAGWLWGVVMALVIAAIAGSQYDVGAQLKLARPAGARVRSPRSGPSRPGPRSWPP